MSAINPFNGTTLTESARTFISNHSDAEVMTILLYAVQQAAASGGGGVGGSVLTEVPADAANGAELPGRPTVTRGATFYVPAGGTVTWFIAPAGTTPGSAPDNTITYSPTNADQFDVPVSGSDSVFITATTGGVLFRWV